MNVPDNQRYGLNGSINLNNDETKSISISKKYFVKTN